MQDLPARCAHQNQELASNRQLMLLQWKQEVAATYLRRVGAAIEYAEDVETALELLTR